jgi:hypothetical protein
MPVWWFYLFSAVIWAFGFCTDESGSPCAEYHANLCSKSTEHRVMSCRADWTSNYGFFDPVSSLWWADWLCRTNKMITNTDSVLEFVYLTQNMVVWWYSSVPSNTKLTPKPILHFHYWLTFSKCPNSIYALSDRPILNPNIADNWLWLKRT